MIQGKTIIAGPCSVESKTQLEETVRGIARVSGIDYIRCGVWKPRSRPGGFEGHGETALNWIDEIKQCHPDLHFMVEVAEAEHIDVVVRHNVDAVWIGARTACSPFLVQDIAHAMRGLDIDVFVKNPMAPDVALWAGAIERVSNACVRNVFAIHRGFSTCLDGRLRNEPIWIIPLRLRKLLPHIPILCDPSHISGKREMIGQIAATSLALGFDGLMLECHNNPDQALTDSRQQLTPECLDNMLVEVFASCCGINPADVVPDEIKSMISGLQEVLAVSKCML